MPDTMPMKVLTVVSVAIVVVDLEVLRKTFTEYFQLKQVLENEPYQQCYKPQAQLRIVFQCYAIYAAAICTSLTSMLAFQCTDQFVESVARLLINLCFLVFGPILLTFFNYGFVHFKQLSFVCTPKGPSHHINFTDIVLLLGCFILALCVTFTMAMQKTLDMAQQSFQDENSLIYRLTSMYFSYQVRHSQERDRQQLRQRAEERREVRRLRQAEREQVLAAFQNQHPEVTAGGAAGSTCPRARQIAGASSQASTVGFSAPQRTLEGAIEAQALRGNRDLGNFGAGGALQTMPSSEDQELGRHHLLEEDFDEEASNLHQGIHQRVTNYEYAQTQEEKQLQHYMNNMPEAQIVNTYVTLNQQIAANEAARNRQNTGNNNPRSAFRMHDVDAVSVRNVSPHLHMADDEADLSVNNNQIKIEDEEENVHAEQLIKDDAKTSSGVSVSQASTQFQTQMGSQISSGAAAATSAQYVQGRLSQGAAACAVPPSNNGASSALSVLNEESQSEYGFQSVDGAASAQNAQGSLFDGQSREQPKKDSQQKKQKKE